MKKFILLVAMMTCMFTGNVAAAEIKIDYSKNLVNVITALSDSLSLAEFSNSLYTIDINDKKTARLSKLLNLDETQTEMLKGVHDKVSKDFLELNFISDDTVRENKFNKIIKTWRKSAYKVFMNGDHRYDMESRYNYRFYWAVVATTLNNKGITSFGEFKMKPATLAIH